MGKDDRLKLKPSGSNFSQFSSNMVSQRGFKQALDTGFPQQGAGVLPLKQFPPKQYEIFIKEICNRFCPLPPPEKKFMEDSQDRSWIEENVS